MRISFLQKLFRFGKRDSSSALPPDEWNWLMPPRDVHETEAWDRHWQNQISHGLGPGIFDIFCRDEELVRAMRERGMTTVLCAGNGISQEPRALAEAGFQVTALDSSKVAIEIAQAWRFTPEQSQHYFPLDLCQSGGNVNFVIGDLLDPMASPGPFDVVIERCTLQLFPPDERGGAVDALARRLQPEGIFLSHCHNGAWRPGEDPIHVVESVFAEKGWTIENGYQALQSRGRVALLSLSTG